MKPARQQRHDPAEGKPGVRPPVQKDDGLAILVALLCVMKSRTGFQSNGFESQACHDLPFNL
jgi:hypothetical protein